MLSYSIYNDGELLQLLKQSDEKAFTEIYNRYWKKLYGVAWYHLHSKEIAEDTVQEVMAALWKRKQVLEIQSLPNYLATAVKYCVFKEIAKGSRDAKALPQAGGTESSLADFRFLQDMLQKEINRLPEKCRFIFRQSRDQGLTNKAIAEELHIHEKSVEQHITRALRHLRTQLRMFFFLL